MTYTKKTTEVNSKVVFNIDEVYHKDTEVNSKAVFNIDEVYHKDNWGKQ
jgi:hypothetical protein